MATDDVMDQFVGVTGATAEEARFYLESAHGDVDVAASAYLDAHGARSSPTDSGEAGHPAPEAQVVDSSSAAASRGPAADSTAGGSTAGTGPQSRNRRNAAARASGGVRGFGDLATSDSDTDDGPQGNELYTGGAKSGQVVKAPKNDQGGPNAEAIFNMARQAGAETGTPEDLRPPAAPAASAFRGQPRRLGDDPGAAAPATTAAEPQADTSMQPISHTITFYDDGTFVVNDGPPRDMRSPENAAFMGSITKGECPRELEPPSRGQPVNVNLVRASGPYVEPPKPAYTAFSGAARTLASSLQAQSAATATAAPQQQQSSATASGSAATAAEGSSSWSGPDESQPCTSIQFRLVDGSRLVARFNLTQTVGDLRRFLTVCRPELPPDFRLATAFPAADLPDDSITLQEARLANAVVVQKKA